MNYPIDYRSSDFLRQQIRNTMAFYDAHAFDPSGGFYHGLMNNGEHFDPTLKTLVASCRFVFNYAKAYENFGRAEHYDRLMHGLGYLRNVHRNPSSGAYSWKINASRPVDSTNHCYGLAFVMLAYANATRVGVAEAKAWIYETYALMEQHFWLADHGLYACEADADWHITSYRGQNDNMHACEAMIAAYEATQDVLFLDRACLLAENITRRQSTATSGHVWEHYTQDWSPDLDYNRNDKDNHIRPWGVQTGHQTEWTKLLLILDRHRPQAWRLERAKALFDQAMKYGWDKEFRGLRYGYDLDGKPCDEDKYFWVQAESIAAAALLAARTGDGAYWDWYDKLWDYSFYYFVDHIHGAWYRILTRENVRYDDRKSYNNKTDYHTMGACYDVLSVVAKSVSRKGVQVKLESPVSLA